MKRIKTALATTFLLLTPAALVHAETTVTTDVTLTYDTARLTSAEGVAFTLKSLEKQAKTVCKSRKQLTNAPRKDPACERAVLNAAITRIANTSLTGAYRLATQNDSPRFIADNMTK